MIKQSKLTSSKQSRVNQLRTVYQSILRNFEKEAVRMKMNETKMKKNPFSDDSLLFKAHKTLPKLQIDKSGKTRNKYYSNKLIVNQAVFIHERRQTTYREYINSNDKKSEMLDKKSFQKIDIPNPLKQQSVLSERNKRILELYKRVEKDGSPGSSNMPPVSPIKISFVRNLSQQFNMFDQKEKPKDQADVSYQQFENAPEFTVQGKGQISQNLQSCDKKMITILKQAKVKRNKLEFPKMKSHRARSSVIAETPKSSNQKILKCTKLSTQKETKQMNSSEIKSQKKEQKTITTTTKFKSMTKLEQPKSNVVLNIRKKKFNWRNEPLNLQKITKEEFYNLNRGYMRINSIQQINLGFYRAYIGNGNNSAIVKKTLKDRGCWTIVESLDDNPHFVWTQLKYPKFSDQLPTDKIQSSDSCLLPNFSQQLPSYSFEEQLSEQLKEFIKDKNNQFTLGCQKILNKQVYKKLMTNIKQRFKNNSYLQHFRKLRYYALECFSTVKYTADSHDKEPLKANDIKLHNHIDGAGAIGDKKGLFYYMNKYTQLFDENINDIIPQTIHVDPENLDQEQIFENIPQGPWILKPGQITNRGHGISVHITRQSLLAELAKKKKHQNSSIKYTNIIQHYIFPLLYWGRKFDIRIWILWNGRSRQAWWYQQGYIRTSSKQFTLRSTNKYIHLTNDAIQSQSQDYGKHEPGNKVSFNQFNKYLQNFYGYKQFNQKMIKQMKQLAMKVFKIGNLVFDPKNKQNTFELFGFDYLIDNKFKPWLIQCNTNPCLEVTCSLLSRLVPNMLDNLMNLTVDTYYPQPTKKKIKDSQPWNHQSFKFQLLYDANQDIGIKQRILTNPNIDIAYKGQYQEEMNQ